MILVPVCSPDEPSAAAIYCLHLFRCDCEFSVSVDIDCHLVDRCASSSLRDEPTGASIHSRDFVSYCFFVSDCVQQACCYCGFPLLHVQ